MFNGDKLNWMNGLYIRGLTADEFYQVAKPYLMKDEAAAKAVIANEGYVRDILPLVQKRAKTLAEIAELTEFFFVDELDYDPALLIGKKMTQESSLQALDASKQRLEKLAAFDTESLEGCLRPLAEELGLKAGQLFGVLRVAVTGRTAAPPLFQTMSVLGRECCLKRIETALDVLHKLSS